ncbi:helix-turn-helix transcriptional regulator [Nocardia yamanashiensis]|uniref:helix-turn-helix transcriptional regulator n=1 Tax=Nocardia yamanashiensis TaxID=209247 RepID=UPI0022B851ED|nr:LuxR family transcriptional regulator [Nocardia yamanashiensis]
MIGAGHEHGLLGRGAEQTDTEQLLTAAHAGRGGAQVLWGDPGIGRTALLRDIAHRATGFRTLTCNGAAAEAGLPYAALHELLLPLENRLHTLPEPQAAALGAALGLHGHDGSAAAPDRDSDAPPDLSPRRDPGAADGFLVGAALVTLLPATAAARPLLLIVDDAHFIDRATAQALVFAVRRLAASPVVLFVTLPDDPAGTAWEALPAHRLRTLSAPDARLLLARRGGARGAARTARALAVAAGNPLALRELPVDAEEFAGIAWGPVPLGPRLRSAFAPRLAALPATLRTLLALAAAEDRGIIATVTTAATALGVTAADWEQALTTGLLALGDGRVEQRHRLLCNAAYDALPRARRRAIHQALAAALTIPAAPSGSGSPNGSPEDTATVSEGRADSGDRPGVSAVVPGGLGGPGGAVGFTAVSGGRGDSGGAAGLTAVPGGRGDSGGAPGFTTVPGGRSDSGGAAGFTISPAGRGDSSEVPKSASHGGLESVVDLRNWHSSMATDGPDGELADALAAGAERVRARYGPAAAAAVLRRAAAITPDSDAAGVRLSLAARFAWDSGDIESARRLLALAATRTSAARVAAAGGGLAGMLELITGDMARAGTMLLRDTAVVDAETAAQLRLLAARSRWATGADDLEPITGQLEIAYTAMHPAVAARLLPPAAQVMAWGLADRAVESYTRVAAQLQVTGAHTGAIGLLPQLAILQLATGRWEAGKSTLAEAFDLARAGDTDNVLAQCWTIRARLAALRGNAADVAESAENAQLLARPRNATFLIAASYWHQGFHALTVGDPETAHLRLRALVTAGHEARHPTLARLAAVDLVEAATRAGRFDEAADYTDLIRAWALRTRTPWAIAAAYTCSALLSEDDRADHCYRRALAVDATGHHTFARARIQLLYGKWLRRARRRRDAAEQLRTAAEAFDLMDAAPWSDNARRELELTVPRPKTPAALGDSPLTMQELKVAQLAAQGMTNREIGAELILSPRTVGHHLSRIFEKLGLSGRGELARVDFDNGLRIIRPR